MRIPHKNKNILSSGYKNASNSLEEDISYSKQINTSRTRKYPTKGQENLNTNNTSAKYQQILDQKIS